MNIAEARQSIENQYTINKQNLDSQYQTQKNNLSDQVVSIRTQNLSDIEQQKQQALNVIRGQQQSTVKLLNVPGLTIVGGGTKSADIQNINQKSQEAQVSAESDVKSQLDKALKDLDANYNQGLQELDASRTQAHQDIDQQEQQQNLEQLKAKQQFDGTHVKLSTGENINKSDFQKLGGAEQQYLLQNGTQAFNNRTGQQIFEQMQKDGKFASDETFGSYDPKTGIVTGMKTTTRTTIIGGGKDQDQDFTSGVQTLTTDESGKQELVNAIILPKGFIGPPAIGEVRSEDVMISPEQKSMAQEKSYMQQDYDPLHMLQNVVGSIKDYAIQEYDFLKGGLKEPVYTQKQLESMYNDQQDMSITDKLLSNQGVIKGDNGQYYKLAIGEVATPERGVVGTVETALDWDKILEDIAQSKVINKPVVDWAKVTGNLSDEALAEGLARIKIPSDIPLKETEITLQPGRVIEPGPELFPSAKPERPAINQLSAKITPEVDGSLNVKDINDNIISNIKPIEGVSQSQQIRLISDPKFNNAVKIATIELAKNQAISETQGLTNSQVQYLTDIVVANSLKQKQYPINVNKIAPISELKLSQKDETMAHEATNIAIQINQQLQNQYKEQLKQETFRQPKFETKPSTLTKQSVKTKKAEPTKESITTDINEESSQQGEQFKLDFSKVGQRKRKKDEENLLIRRPRTGFAFYQELDLRPKLSRGIINEPIVRRLGPRFISSTTRDVSGLPNQEQELSSATQDGNEVPIGTNETKKRQVINRRVRNNTGQRGIEQVSHDEFIKRYHNAQLQEEKNKRNLSSLG